MIINSKEERDSEAVLSEAEWDFWGRKKAFAVGVFAIVWSGGEMPRVMIREAISIKRQMVHNGTWKPA